jgi:hypothetical protein
MFLKTDTTDATAYGILSRLYSKPPGNACIRAMTVCGDQASGVWDLWASQAGLQPAQSQALRNQGVQEKPDCSPTNAQACTVRQVGCMPLCTLVYLFFVKLKQQCWSGCSCN